MSEEGYIWVPWEVVNRECVITLGSMTPGKAITSRFTHRRKANITGETKQQRKSRQQITRLKILSEESHLPIDDRIAYFQWRVEHFANLGYKSVGLRPSMHMLLKLMGDRIFDKHCER